MNALIAQGRRLARQRRRLMTNERAAHDGCREAPRAWGAAAGQAAGLSSNDALQKAKWLLRAEKAGHTGTLDPLATGVLPLCFGAATKFSQLHLDADKTYEAVAALGVPPPPAMPKAR
jgi:hypothetical protein